MTKSIDKKKKQGSVKPDDPYLTPYGKLVICERFMNGESIKDLKRRYQLKTAAIKDALRALPRSTVKHSLLTEYLELINQHSR